MRTESFNRFTDEKSDESSGRKYWVIGIVVVLLLVFSFFLLRSGATFTYTPKTLSLVFTNDSYSATQTGSNGELSYSVIKLSGEKSAEAPASGEETVSIRATGRVMIYNEQNSSQQLVKTTRLQTDDGKIFRIENDVTIPSKGSVEVGVVADQPGESYNIALSDFTVPGFKGSAKFEKVYARSKTEMSGGFVGTRPKVVEGDMAKLRSSLESTLKDELVSQAGAQVPQDFILFPNLIEINSKFLPTESLGKNTAKVTLQTDLNAIIFKKTELARYLAGKKSEDKNLNEKMNVKDISKLSVSLLNSVNATSTIKVNLLGSLTLVAVTDESALASDLANLKKVELDTLLAKYPSVSDASVAIRPFWKSNFPADPSKIKIVSR